MAKQPSILLVSNYFPPERGAAPNRIQVLAKALHQRGYTVEVVCPLPNYPTGRVFSEFKGKLYSNRVENQITVHRLWLWPSKSSNKFIRLLSMLSFSFALKLFFIFKRTPKLVVVQYSPVFVGFTAMLLSTILGKKKILNVSDLWPLAGLEMGLLKRGFYYSILERMERYCYKKADLIIGQSQEILSHIASFNVDTPLQLYRNFPDFNPPSLVPSKNDSTIKIVYAGLLGVAQGLSTILDHIDFPKNVELHIYGEGPDTKRLVNPKNLQIVYHGSVSRALLHQQLGNYDLAFIPLVKRIYGSVPSKIFEYSRMGLPLLYMAGGEGAALVNEHRLGWVIEVQDYAGLEQFLKGLTRSTLEEFSKVEVQSRAIQAFDFNAQFQDFIDTLKTL
ncbi:MAG: glycosyltransferase family 4 protein [Marinirhabdus sp.]|nr:glycosyltransferase family 4 protein [Marinirhabdus sp.]